MNEENIQNLSKCSSLFRHLSVVPCSEWLWVSCGTEALGDVTNHSSWTEKLHFSNHPSRSKISENAKMGSGFTNGLEYLLFFKQKTKKVEVMHSSNNPEKQLMCNFIRTVSTAKQISGTPHKLKGTFHVIYTNHQKTWTDRYFRMNCILFLRVSINVLTRNLLEPHCHYLFMYIFN